MSTIQIADKTTLDNTKTNTTNLLTKGGIKYNATSQKYQTYNTTNSSWVDTEFGGGGGNPTIVIKNEGGVLNNKSITVSNDSLDFTSTKNMGVLDYLIFDVPMLNEYIVTDGTKSIACKVDNIGGAICPFSYTMISFSSGTDAQISDILNAHYNDLIDISDIWSIGDTRIIHLDSFNAPNPNSSSTWVAQDIAVSIVAFNHTTLETPINGHDKSAITVQTREVLSGTSAGTAGNMYITGSSAIESGYTPWSSLYMRTYLNNQVWGAFPSEFKQLIKYTSHYCRTSYSGTESTNVSDHLFLPSYPEIYGDVLNSYYSSLTSPTEGTQFPYYKIESNCIKYANNNGEPAQSYGYWWTGSGSTYRESTQYSYYVCWIGVSAAGNIVAYRGDKYCALAPAFAM